MYVGSAGKTLTLECDTNIRNQNCHNLCAYFHTCIMCENWFPKRRSAQASQTLIVYVYSEVTSLQMHVYFTQPFFPLPLARVLSAAEPRRNTNRQWWNWVATTTPYFHLFLFISNPLFCHCFSLCVSFYSHHSHCFRSPNCVGLHH